MTAIVTCRRVVPFRTHPSGELPPASSELWLDVLRLCKVLAKQDAFGGLLLGYKHLLVKCLACLRPHNLLMLAC